MKNELLARAISELDDDLLEEAHQPIQKKKHPITHLQSWAALAACFVVLVASLMPLRSKDDIGVFVNGVNMMRKILLRYLYLRQHSTGRRPERKYL